MATPEEDWKRDVELELEGYSYSDLKFMQQDIAKHQEAWNKEYPDYEAEESKQQAYDSYHGLKYRSLLIEWELEKRLAYAIQMPLYALTPEEYELECDRRQDELDHLEYLASQNNETELDSSETD